MKLHSRGFTLMELMTALAVVGILVAITVPAFRGFAANSRNAAATNSLVTALNLARSEALRRSAVVRVCASADQATCSGAANGWTAGWLVYVDNNLNGAVDADELIQVWPALEGNLTAVGTASEVAYNALGMGLSALSVDVTPPTCSGNQVGRTAVALSGTIQTQKVACP